MSASFYKRTCLFLFLLMFAGTQLWAQKRQETFRITGKVVSSDGDGPIPGASVTIKGTYRGVPTDSEGNFEIEVRPNDTLVVSSIGYAPLTQPVMPGKIMELVLKPDLTQLSDIVVVGYGMQDRRDLTGSIATVKGEELQKVPALSFDNALAGQAPGVLVNSSSGVPGSATSITIRGISTLTGDANNPLIVIDGVPVYGTGQDLNTVNFSASVTAPIGFGGTVVANNYRPDESFERNPLANLNPADIESIEILKDAFATSIYGSRGAAGVILITTKRGAKENPTINFRYAVGSIKPIGRHKLLNGAEYNDIYTRFSNAIGKGAFTSQYDTDWQEAVMQEAISQEATISVSGGSEKSSHFLSASYLSQPSYILNQDFKRYSGRSNLQYNGNTVSFGTNLSLSFTDNRALNAQAIYREAILKAPNLPIYDEEGNYNWGIGTNPFGTVNSNPVSVAKRNINQVQDTRTVSNVYLSLFPVEWLTLKSEAGIDLMVARSYSRKAAAPGMLPNGDAVESININRKFVVNNTATFNYKFNGKHYFDGVIGQSFETSVENTNTIASNNFPDDGILSIGATNSESRRVRAALQREWAMLSYFVRLNYQLNEKYLAGITYRVDGSSRFSRNQRYVGFPAFSMGWRMSREPFMSSVNWVKDLKLRGSVGLTGVQGGSASSYYGYQGQYTFEDSNYGNLPILAVEQPPNPNLEWQKTLTFDAGIDASLFDGTVDVILDYYYRKTDNLLFSTNIPLYRGFSQQEQNLGSMRNAGVELKITSNRRFGRFHWISSFNIAANRNKILKLNFNSTEVQIAQYGGKYFTEGQPAGQFFLFQWVGVDPQTGDPLWLDGDGVISTSPPENRFRIDDTNRHRKVMGSNMPDFFGGFNNTITYRGFELTAFFVYSYGNKIFNGSKASLMTYSTEAGNNLSRDILDFWRIAGHNTEIPKLLNKSITTAEGPSSTVGVESIRDYTVSRASSRFLEDGSYLRLRSLHLAYNIPPAVLERTTQNVVSRMQLYVLATNLLTITPYSGIDPEISEFGSNVINGGVDELTMPQTKQFQIGINISL